MDGFEGACTGRNFVGQGFGVKRCDEMLGMQMRWNRPYPGRDAARSPCEALLRRTGTATDAGAWYGPGLCSAPLRKGYALRCVRGTKPSPVNAFLTINRANFA